MKECVLSGRIQASLSQLEPITPPVVKIYSLSSPLLLKHLKLSVVFILNTSSSQQTTFPSLLLCRLLIISTIVLWTGNVFQNGIRYCCHPVEKGIALGVLHMKTLNAHYRHFFPLVFSTATLPLLSPLSFYFTKTLISCCCLPPWDYQVIESHLHSLHANPSEIQRSSKELVLKCSRDEIKQVDSCLCSCLPSCTERVISA